MLSSLPIVRSCLGTPPIDLVPPDPVLAPLTGATHLATPFGDTALRDPARRAGFGSSGARNFCVHRGVQGSW